jgi:hypothetical protein
MAAAIISPIHAIAGPSFLNLNYRYAVTSALLWRGVKHAFAYSFRQAAPA